MAKCNQLTSLPFKGLTKHGHNRKPDLNPSSNQTLT